MRLRRGDIDFERGKIALVRSKVGNCDHVDLHPALAEELARLRKERGRVAARDHVFLSRQGRAWTDIRCAWKTLLSRAGLDDRDGLTPHSVRHSFATHFLENGGAVTDLMAQLGHRKLETTQIYASALSTRRRATVLAMEF